uniref:MADF domain-containing protein n=1 Tax=Timema poppense TaxID=170557 RepID=A0A7R9D3N3_TIMPO|nr:unnamed protein product [Timema poppensis]
MEKSKLTKKELLLKEKEEERVFLMKCIELYQSLPVLWKVKSDDYMDRDKKAQAYEKLLELYHERYPKATREDLAKKFNSLRTNFRKDLKKMNDSKKSGAGAEEVYESTLWYFDSMKFLIDQETPSDSINTCEDESEGSVVDFSVIHDTENAVSSTPRPTKKKRPQPKDPADELIRLACTRLQEPVSAELQVATTWATELMKMAPQQQLFAKKFINEIIFEGQMAMYDENFKSSKLFPVARYRRVTANLSSGEMAFLITVSSFFINGEISVTNS